MNAFDSIDKSLIIPDKVYYQSNTENKSFLRMYKFLRDKGIKNNKFFLALYDKDLMDIRPLELNNPNKYLKTKILRECVINPWYYLREICRIKVPGGITRYILNRGNLAMTYCLLNNINVTMMMPRQQGKTIGAAALFNWLFRFGTTNSSMIFSNKQKSDASLNLKRFAEFIDELTPYWLKDPVSKEDTNNTECFAVAARGNVINVLPGASSADAADKLGRGCTIPIAWWDEFAFSAYNKVFYNSATFALSKARSVALANGKPSFKLITTTPNSIDLPEGQYCKMMMDMADQFDEKNYYDCPVEKLLDYVSEHSENDFVHIEFSWRQLGMDDKWYKTQMRMCNFDKMTIKREVDLEWTLSSDKSPFSEEELENVNRFIVPQDNLIKFNTGYKGYRLYLTEPPDFYRPVTLACDCSGGLGLDRSVMHIMNNDDGTVIGSFYSNRIDTDDFANLIEHVGTKIFTNSVWAIERNSYGLAIIQKLAKRPAARMRLFYEDKSKAKPGEKFASIDDNKGRVYGIDTTSKSRDIMIDNLFRYIADEPHKFRIPLIYKELKTIERKNNGKIEHADGEHDDTVMAYLIGRYAQSCDTFKYFKNKIYIRKNNLVNTDEDEEGKIIVRPYRSIEKRIDAAETTKDFSISKTSKIFNLNRH